MQLSIKSPATSPVTLSGKRMMLGLFGPMYYGGFSPFLNWWKQAQDVVVLRNAGGNISGQAAIDAGYLTADGELVSPVPSDVVAIQKVIYQTSGNPGHDATGEQFTVEFTGTASSLFLSVPGTGAVQPGSTSGTTFKLGSNPAAPSLAFFVTPGSTTPPRNINVYQTRYASAVAAGKKFNPDWVNVIKDFNPLRWLLINDSLVVNYSDFATESYTTWTNQRAQQGVKYHLPLSMWTTLAEETGCDVWFCIPHQATDACVTSIATHFRDNLPEGRKVWFEYSNETWNGGFSQRQYCDAQAASKGLQANNGWRFSGYRSAECMKIIRDVFNDRSRWRGVLAPQTASSFVTTEMLVGVAAWKTATGSSLNVSDLFDEIAVTGYFGETVPAWAIQGITKGAQTVITAIGSGGSVNIGDEVVFCHRDSSSGMPEIQEKYATVTAINGDNFTVNIDSTNYANWTSTGNTYFTFSKFFRLMDRSEELHASNPTLYPTEYTYFARQYEQLCTTGTCDFGISISKFYSLDYMDNRDPFSASLDPALSIWGRQKDVADQYGLELSMYEGGMHFCPGGGSSLMLTGNFSTNPIGMRLSDIIVNVGYTEEIGRVYADVTRRFLAAGGVRPTKFVEGGIASIYGAWAGIRYWPLGTNTTPDLNNPVWKAVTASTKAYFAP